MRYLTPPGIAWNWSESGVPHKVKYNWKDEELIHRAPDGSRWETSMKLWCHAISRAGDDETVGEEATGQQIFVDVPPKRTGSPVSTAPDLLPPTTREPTQLNLDGDVIEDENESGEGPSEEKYDWIIGRTSAKNSTKPSPRNLAANHPSQTKLSRWAESDGIPSCWDTSKGGSSETKSHS